MRCSQCGTVIHEDEANCSNCGFPVSQIIEKEPECQSENETREYFESVKNTDNSGFEIKPDNSELQNIPEKKNRHIFMWIVSICSLMFVLFNIGYVCSFFVFVLFVMTFPPIKAFVEKKRGKKESKLITKIGKVVVAILLIVIAFFSYVLFDMEFDDTYYENDTQVTTINS